VDTHWQGKAFEFCESLLNLRLPSLPWLRFGVTVNK
jgi:hypothetical protein